jgi:hypothetical protein
MALPKAVRVSDRRSALAIPSSGMKERIYQSVPTGDTEVSDLSSDMMAHR